MFGRIAADGSRHPVADPSSSAGAARRTARRLRKSLQGINGDTRELSPSGDKTM